MLMPDSIFYVRSTPIKTYKDDSYYFLVIISTPHLILDHMLIKPNLFSIVTVDSLSNI